jgi:hypothetical protein
MRYFPELRRKWRLRNKRRELEQRREQVWNAYEKDIKEATTSDERQMLEVGQYEECSEFEDELLSIDSTEICRRARLCHLSIKDFPLPPGETSYWVTGRYGARYIEPKTFREFTKAVETAEYERAKRDVELKDFWLKIFTAAFAAAAAVASIVNLFTSHKH